MPPSVRSLKLINSRTLGRNGDLFSVQKVARIDVIACVFSNTVKIAKSVVIYCQSFFSKPAQKMNDLFRRIYFIFPKCDFSFFKWQSRASSKVFWGFAFLTTKLLNRFCGNTGKKTFSWIC
jgi:hypothetical protein